MTLTQSRLKELLDYDPETGVFTWRVDRGCNRCKGKRAGRVQNTGYREILVDGRGYRAHRLAFLYVAGALPPDIVDHRNGNKDDNAWHNLRLADASTNQQNQRASHRDSTHGYLGVTFNKQKRRWASRIVVDGKRRLLGYFDAPGPAHLAYLEAKRASHAGCTI